MTIDFKSFIEGMGLVIVIIPLIQGLVGFILDLIELFSSYLRNKQTLHASKIQAEIDSLNISRESVSAIGFKHKSTEECEGDEGE